MRNAIEIGYEDREREKLVSQQQIQQKKDELNRLHIEHESLLRVLALQESEMK